MHGCMGLCVAQTDLSTGQTLVGQLVLRCLACLSCLFQDLRKWTLVFTTCNVRYERELRRAFWVGFCIRRPVSALPFGFHLLSSVKQ